MNVFTQQRLNTSIIVLLVILNITALATIWLQQARQRPPAGPEGRGPVENFLTQELGLTQEQAGQFERLRQEHFQDSKALGDSIRPLKEAIMQEVFAASPDSAKVKTLAEEIGAKQAQLEELRFQHFLALKSVCQPEQLEKFQGLFHEFFPPQPPHNESRPPQPRPEQERRSGAGSPMVPREALEACQGKSQGSSCQFTTPHGSVSGTCRAVESQLVCVPKGNDMQRPPGAP